MFRAVYNKIRNGIVNWLIYEPPTKDFMPYDFNRMQSEIRPGDVLLIEGRSRISSIIRSLTHSCWTHAALYIGRLVDFENEEAQTIIRKFNITRDNTRLIIEDLMDKGTIVSPLTDYQNHHIRICRPIGITQTDTDLVIHYAIKRLGQRYNVRHILDFARYLLPWSILPRRWRSSLFRTASGEPESGVCSSLIAEAYSSVQFPILPFFKEDASGIEIFPRNPHLFVPKDFDVSPYFEIIKYPLFSPDEPLPYYRRMPWTKTNFYHHDQGIISSMERTEKVKNKNVKEEKIEDKNIKSEDEKKE